MTRSRHHRGPPKSPGAPRAGYAGPREAFDAWLTHDLRRHYGQPVESPLPADLEAVVRSLLDEDDLERE